MRKPCSALHAAPTCTSLVQSVDKRVAQAMLMHIDETRITARLITQSSDLQKASPSMETITNRTLRRLKRGCLTTIGSRLFQTVSIVGVR